MSHLSPPPPSTGGVPGGETAPRAPGPAPTTAPAWPQPGPSATPPVPSDNGGSRTWLYVVGAIAVLLLVAAGIVYFTTGDTTADGDPAGTPTESSSTRPDDETPVTIVTDPETGLSYPQLPAPWSAPDASASPGFRTVVGQQFSTEPGWVAAFVVGEVDTDALDYEGEESLPDLVNEIADLVDEQNYLSPADPSRNLAGLERDVEPVLIDISVGDHVGVSLTYHLAWTDTSLKDTGESVTIGVVDLGDGRAGGFVACVPDLGTDQIEAVANAIAALQIG